MVYKSGDLVTVVLHETFPPYLQDWYKNWVFKVERVVDEGSYYYLTCYEVLDSSIEKFIEPPFNGKKCVFFKDELSTYKVIKELV